MTKLDPRSVVARQIETFPQVFDTTTAWRKPLKIGIHLDVLERMNGAITPEERSAALRYYCSNVHYDLGGNVVGSVSEEEPAHGKAHLIKVKEWMAARKKKPQASPEPSAPEPPASPAPPKRLGLADLRKAALARAKAKVDSS